MKRAFLVAVLIIAGLVLAAAGYAVGRGSARHAPAPAGSSNAASETAARQVWTCSMHPQVRLEQAGDCPICEMPLIPATAAGPSDGEAPTLQLSEHALAMASVETVAVEHRPLTRELRAVGRIEFNESSLASITPRVDGYAERLFVNFTGVEIREGDHLAEVYSPELLVAQQELLIAVQNGAGAGPLVDVARNRLRLLGLTEEQVTNLVEKKQTTDRVTLFSPISGTVIEKSIVEKAAFKAGDALYRIANLDSVWVYLEVYEYDLPWIRYGQRVRVTAEALPGRTIEGMVTFVQPIVNEQSRTVRIPVHIDNKDHGLKPGMFVSAAIEASLTADGRAAPTGVEGRFTCPMHPQVLADAAGACSICDMPLERIPGTPGTSEPGHDHAAGDREPERADDQPVMTPTAKAYFCPMKCEGEKTYDQPGRCPVCKMKLKEVEAPSPTTAPGAGGMALAVPVSAVLDSGTRKIVYVERSRGLFESREIVVGPRAGSYYALLAGLAAGERVVKRGNFLIDSQFQVTGHPSLFHPGGLHAAPGHDHAGAPGGDPSGAPADPSGTPDSSSTDHGHAH